MGTSIVEYVLRVSGNLPSETKAAATAVRDLEQRSDKAKTALEKLGQLGGGALGDLTSGIADATDLLDGLGAAVGTAGLAIGAFGAAAVIAGLGAKGLADAASAAGARLSEAGLAATIPESARRSVEEYDAATKALGATADRLTVSLGSGVAGALGQIEYAMVGAESSLETFAKRVDEVGPPVGRLNSAFSWVFPAKVAFESFSAILAKVADNGRLVADSMKSISDFTNRPLSDYEKMLQDMAAGQITKPGPKDWAGYTSGAAAREAERQQLIELGMLAPDAPSGPAKTAAPAAAVKQSESLTRWLHPLVKLSGESLIAQREAGVLLGKLNLISGEGVKATEDLHTQLAEQFRDRSGMDVMRTVVTGVGAQLAGPAGAVGWLRGALSAITGVYGQLVSLIRDLPGQIIGMIGDARQIYTALPTALRQVLQTLPTALIKAGPEIFADFISTVPMIGQSLVAATPDLVRAIVGAIPTMAGVFVGAMARNVGSLFRADYWAQVGREIGKAFLDGIKQWTHTFGRDGALGTNFNPAKGDTRLLGIKLPHFDSAMRRPVTLTQTGLAVVHKGEEIRRAGTATVTGGGGLHVHVHGTLVGASAGRELASLLRRELGSYGGGSTLAPLAR